MESECQPYQSSELANLASLLEKNKVQLPGTEGIVFTTQEVMRLLPHVETFLRQLRNKDWYKNGENGPEDDMVSLACYKRTLELIERDPGQDESQLAVLVSATRTYFPESLINNLLLNDSDTDLQINLNNNKRLAKAIGVDLVYGININVIEQKICGFLQKRPNLAHILPSRLL